MDYAQGTSVSTDLDNFSQPATLEVTFGQLEAAIAAANRIADDKRTAFQARLKNLLKLNLLPEVQAGRGKAALFNPWHMFVMGLAVECSQLGLVPTRVVDVLRENVWQVAQMGKMVGRHGRPRGGFDMPMTVTFDPSGWIDLARPGRHGDIADATFNYAGIGQLKENLTNWFAQGFRRVSIINVSMLVWDLASRTNIHMVDQFYAQLADLADSIQLLLDDEDDQHPQA